MGCLRSLRAHQALDGVSWVQSGSVEVAVGGTSRVLQNRRRHLLPPSGVAPLGSSVRSPLRLRLLGYAGSNSVPCSNIACIMMARRFLFNDSATTEIYTLSLHDALPLCTQEVGDVLTVGRRFAARSANLIDDLLGR